MTVFLSPSFCSLPNDRFNNSSKASSPQSTIQCFPVNFQYPLVSVLSPSSCLRRPYRTPVTIKLSIIFPLIRCFERHFLRKKWPIKSAFLSSFLPSFIVCMFSLSSLTLCHTFLFLTRSVQLIFSVLLQHISKLPRYFCSTFRSVQFSTL